jgi:hypothetical protein
VETPEINIRRRWRTTLAVFVLRLLIYNSNCDPGSEECRPLGESLIAENTSFARIR